jgi:hypothetical protein
LKLRHFDIVRFKLIAIAISLSNYNSLRHLNRPMIGQTILVMRLSKRQDIEMQLGHTVIGIKTKAAFYATFVFMGNHFLK